MSESRFAGLEDLGSARKVVIRGFKNQVQTNVWTPKPLLSEHYPLIAILVFLRIFGRRNKFL
jgi:hypothetical protein